MLIQIRVNIVMMSVPGWYIQRIDEMERILRFLTDELSRVPGGGYSPATLIFHVFYNFNGFDHFTCFAHGTF